MQIQVVHSFILFGSVQRLGVHPRHPPRTFPLGLLAPRCLGLALLLTIARLRTGGSGALLFEGRKESPPSFASVRAPLRYAFRRAEQGSPNRLIQPPSSFSHTRVLWCRFRFRFLYCKITAMLIQGRGRPSGKCPKARSRMCLPLPPSAHTNPPACGRGCSLEFVLKDNIRYDTLHERQVS